MKNIDLVWFKRDLRLTDHQPLVNAIKGRNEVVLIYVFEPSLVAAPEYDVRHWRFVWESLVDLNLRLEKYGAKIHIFFDEVLNVLERLRQKYVIQTIHSHEETGIKITYDRDKAVQSFCKKNNIQWTECQDLANTTLEFSKRRCHDRSQI